MSLFRRISFFIIEENSKHCSRGAREARSKKKSAVAAGTNLGHPSYNDLQKVNHLGDFRKKKSKICLSVS